MAFAIPAQAIDWRFQPTVSAYATYTDNVNQSAHNPESSLILGATPGFSLRSQGSRRIHAALQYGLTGVTRFGGDRSDDLFHNLNAVGKAELVEDFLFLDGTANISQQLISLLGSPADASTNSSNRTTVGTYSLSPYVVKRFGTFANATVRYTASGAIFQNNVAPDSSANSLNAQLNSGTRFDDLSWGLNYSLRKAENRNAANSTFNGQTTFESASASVGYALTRKFRVFGTVGHDWNDYLSSTNTSGSSYSVGAGWAPTRLTSVEASVGERYFGRTFSFSGNHRTRLSRWNVRYSEDVSDITQQFLEANSRMFWDCPLTGANLYTPVSDPTQPPAPTCRIVTAGEIIAMNRLSGLGASRLGLTDIGVANGIFIIKNFNASVSWEIRRLGFGLSAQDTRRLYQMSGNAEDHIQSVIGSVNYRMTPTVTASSSLSLTRNSLDSVLTGGAPRQDDILSWNASLNRRFTAKLDGALTLRHTQRDSNDANSSYDENSLTASVNMRF